MPASGFFLFPLGPFSPFSVGVFSGWASDFEGAGVADSLAEFLCSSSFTVASSLSAFILDRAVGSHRH